MNIGKDHTILPHLETVTKNENGYCAKNSQQLSMSHTEENKES